MHEVGIANSILDAVRLEAARYPAACPRQVNVRLGELTAVNPDSLRFCFEALTCGTELAMLKLGIEICPRRHHCPACGAEFAIVNHDFRCARCGEEKTLFISGDELELASLEIEDNESNAA
jgi:hydrogenase nickel incorporation protein HypA/HybF